MFIYLIIFSTTSVFAKIYKVENIEIKEPYNTNFKKTKVIDKAFDSAFKLLLSKIVSSDDYERVKINNLNIIRPMVNSFSIVDEQFINNQYSAKFDVLFEKKKILNFLNNKNIISSIPKEKKIIFFPILVNLENNELFLYEQNIFFSNWKIDENPSYLLKYSLPAEDLEDIKHLTENINNIEQIDFKEILNKYNNEDYIVSIFFQEKKNLNILSKINLDNKQSIIKTDFSNVEIKEFNDQKRIIKYLKTTFENKWKKNNEINTSIKLFLTLSANSKDLVLLNKIEEALLESDLIYKFNVEKISNLETVYKIVYNGTPDKFITDFENKKFKIDISNENWVIYE